MENKINVEYYGKLSNSDGEYDIYKGNDGNYYIEKDGKLELANDIDLDDVKKYDEEEGFEHLDSNQSEESSGSSSGGGYQKLPTATPDNILDHIGDSQDFHYQTFYSAMRTAMSLLNMSSQMGPSLSAETGGLDINIDGLLDCKTCIGNACGIGANQNIEDLVKSLQAINQVVIENDANAMELFKLNELMYGNDLYGDEFYDTDGDGKLSQAEAMQKQEDILKNIENIKSLHDGVYDEINEFIEASKEDYQNASATIADLRFNATQLGMTFDDYIEFLATNDEEKYQSYDKTQEYIKEYENTIAEKYNQVQMYRTIYQYEKQSYYQLFENYDDFDEKSASSNISGLTRIYGVFSESTDTGRDYFYTNSNGEKIKLTASQVSSIIDGDNDASFFQYKDAEGNSVDPSAMSLAFFLEEHPNAYHPNKLNSEANDYLNNYLPYLDDSQKSIMKYLCNTDSKLLSDFIELNQDSVNQLAALESASEFRSSIEAKMASGQNILIGPEIVMEGLGDGIETFFDGLSVVNNGIGSAMSKASYEQAYKINVLNELYSEQEVRRAFHTGAYEISTSIGNMLPSIATSIVVSALAGPVAGKIVGSSLMGLSAGGNAAQEAYINDLMDKRSAFMYGILDGLSETTLELALGGIESLAFGTTSADVVAELAKNGASNSEMWGGLLKNLLRESINEGKEEAVQEILSTVFKNGLTGKNEDIDWNNVLKSGVYGFITAGLMNGGNVVIDGVNYTLNSANINEIVESFMGDPNLHRSEDISQIKEKIKLNLDTSNPSNLTLEKIENRLNYFFETEAYDILAEFLGFNSVEQIEALKEKRIKNIDFKPATDLPDNVMGQYVPSKNIIEINEKFILSGNNFNVGEFYNTILTCFHELLHGVTANMSPDNRANSGLKLPNTPYNTYDGVIYRGLNESATEYLAEIVLGYSPKGYCGYESGVNMISELVKMNIIFNSTIAQCYMYNNPEILRNEFYINMQNKGFTNVEASNIWNNMIDCMGRINVGKAYLAYSGKYDMVPSEGEIKFKDIVTGQYVTEKKLHYDGVDELNSLLSDIKYMIIDNAAINENPNLSSIADPYKTITLDNTITLATIDDLDTTVVE